MNDSLKLGFKVGGHVEWIGSEFRSLKRGMMGKVIKASDNRLAAQVGAETSMDFSAAWVLVDSGNAIQVIVRNRSDLRRVTH